MRFFIQIADSMPTGKPLSEIELRASFPDVQIDNLPTEFVEFQYSPEPVDASGVPETAESSYQWVNSIVKQVWITRPIAAPANP